MNLQKQKLEESCRNALKKEEEMSYDDFHTYEHSTFKLPKPDNPYLQAIIDSDLGIVKTAEGFECSICSYKSKYRSAVVRHMPKHTQEKLFKCSLCQKGFAQKSSLYRHYRSHMVKNLKEMKDTI